MFTPAKAQDTVCSVENGSLVVTVRESRPQAKESICTQKATVCEASSTKHFPYATPENTNDRHSTRSKSYLAQN